MSTIIVFMFMITILVPNVEPSFSNWYPKLKPTNTDCDISDTDGPLLLTPYIENNQIEEGRKLSTVPTDLFQNVLSYSGFLTVDKNFDSNLFFWFFPAKEDYENAPVLLWLQGGPGASSLFAIFEENGPFLYPASKKVTLNSYSWANQHSVIYIDNPVQTGYSFTNGGYAQNQTKVGEDLYEALRQFFLLFPELQKNEFFVTGESYGGKYVPAAAYTIYKKNPTADIKINLKGVAIGNGLCDPEHQLNYGDYLYQLGLVDTNEKKQIDDLAQDIIDSIHAEDFEAAFRGFDTLLNGDLNGGQTLFKNVTGFTYYFNYLYSNGNHEPGGDLTTFLESVEVRKAIHVGNLTYNDGEIVEQNLVKDVMQSVTPWISELLSNIRVLFYNGQLDIIVAYPLTVNFLKHLDFDAADEYKTALKHKWYDGDEIAGYIKQAGNLTEVLVRDAGHLVPGDQPLRAMNLITMFTRNSLLQELSPK